MFINKKEVINHLIEIKKALENVNVHKADMMITNWIDALRTPEIKPRPVCEMCYFNGFCLSKDDKITGCREYRMV